MNIDIEQLQIVFIQYLPQILAFIIAIVGHEIMHGFVAFKLGDNTAKSLGRLSINPIRHIDPIGSLIVPGIQMILSYKIGHPSVWLGWAKPVPINMHTIMQKDGENGAIKVALAGISYNFFLVAIFTIILMISNPEYGSFFYNFLVYGIYINAMLGYFNLWPLPPLDGSQALKYYAMKHRWYSLVVWINKLAPYGFFILMAIIVMTQKTDINPFKPVIWLISKLIY